MRSLEVMGEAAKQIPETFRTNFPHVDWRGMARMRDRLIHGYIGVDYHVVWDVVRTDIPVVKQQIDVILSQEVDPSA